MTNFDNNNPLNAEDLTIAWLDPSIHQIDNNQLDRKIRLRQIIDYLKTFDDSNACVDYITSAHDEHILLIVSGTLGEIVVPLISNLPQVLSIYVLCELRTVHEQWAKTYAKIRGVFIDINQLLVKITQDAALYLRSVTPVTIFSTEANTSLRDLTKDSAAFMWFQLFIQVLVQLPQNQHAKENLLQQCRSYYKGNLRELATIDEFDNTYRAEDAIKWYTRPCFLFNQLNKAFRTENMHEIFKFRFFIYDLYRQLLKLYKEDKNNSTIQHVYRGQLLSKKELDILKQNEGKFVSLNTFFSTSSKSTVAIQYAGNGENRSIGFESVCFDIDMTGDDNGNKLFSSIKSYSYISDEDEVLLSMGHVFLIESVYELTDKIWYVELTLHSREDRQMNRLLGYYRKEFGGTTTLFHFAKILLMMGELDKAEEYISLFFEELKFLYDNEGNPLANNPALVAKIYITLGGIRSSKNDFTGALALFKQVFEIEGLPSIARAEALNETGEIYARQGNFTIAMDKFQQALTEIENTPEPSMNVLATIYSNISYAYSNCGDDENAGKNLIKYFELLLQRSLPSIHPQIAVAGNDLALFNLGKGNYSIAIDNLETALEISLKSLPSNHMRLSALYNNLGLIYYIQGRIDDALATCEKVFDTISFADSHMTATYVIIGLCYINKCDYVSAFQNLQKAEENEKKYFSEDHHTFRLIYGFLGHIYAKIENYDAALNNLKKALDIALQAQPPTFELPALLHMDIGSVYCKTKNYELAYKYCFAARNMLRDFSIKDDHPVMLKYLYTAGNVALSSGNKGDALDFFQKAVSLAAKPSLNSDFELLGSLHECIGQIMVENDELQNGFDHFQKTLEYFLVYLPDSHQRLSSIYGFIGQIHSKRGESSQALDMCQKSIQIELNAKMPNKKVLRCTYALLGLIYGEPSSTVVDYEKALISLNAALEIALSFDPTDRLTISKLYINIGMVQSAKDDLPEAVKWFEKALENERQIHPPNNDDLRIIYSNLAQFYEKMGNNESAIIVFKEAIKIWPLNDTSLADLQLQLGIVSFKSGNRLEAIDILKQAIELKLQVAPVDHSTLAVCYFVLADAYELIENFEMSLELYRKALESGLKVAPADNENILWYKDKIKTLEQKTANHTHT
jgi:tetratricopeptide (TPR) repeat protein